MNAQFVIDGSPKSLTPAQLLGDTEQALESGLIIDETLDPSAGGLLEVDPSDVERYCALTSDAADKVFPPEFPEEYTRFQMARTLTDSLFREGNVRLEDMPVTLKWSAMPSKVGDMSAFYASVSAAADYVDALSLSLRRHSFTEGPLSFKVATPFSGAPLICPRTLVPDPASWIVYIPFDPSDYRLGGSLLAQKLSLGGGCAPMISDPDYLMDCFELVREMVEDGVIIAGREIGSGGLISALRAMGENGVGADLDISDILRAADEKNPARVLFAEVPGVLVQIRDIDFDYMDAECLLQDVAFYPLGHPGTTGSEIKVKSSARTGIQSILDSLARNAEGED